MLCSQVHIYSLFFPRDRGEAGGEVDEALISASVSAQPEEEKPGTSHVLVGRGWGVIFLRTYSHSPNLSICILQSGNQSIES